MSTKHKSLKTICILGDSPLVEEYTSLAVSRYKCVAAPAKSIHLAIELTNISLETKQKNLRLFDRTLPRNVPILSSSVIITAAEQSTWLKHPERLIGVGALPTLLQGSLMEFAPSHVTGDAAKSAARSFAEELGKGSSFVEDSVGLVLPRILCMLVNEACFAMGERVADGSNIDTAMKLGTNYPDGPVHWGKRIGATHVHAVVSALYRHFGEDHYRIAPALQKAAFTCKF